MIEEKMQEDNKDLNPKKRGLGRGLNALFDDGEAAATPSPVKAIPEEAVTKQAEETPGTAAPRRTIGIDKILPNPHQPRRVIDEASIEELSESIKEHGVLQPLLVRRAKGKEGFFEIIAGERRWRASQRAQLHELPVIILDLEDAQAYEIALIENLQREDLNPMDEADGYRKMLDEYNYTQDQLAQKIGKSRSHIANMIRLSGLSVLAQAHLSDGTITIGHARALLRAKNQDELVKKVISQGLSVRQTERLAAADQGQSRAPKKSSGPRARNHQEKDVDTLALEKEVSNALGMNVSIDGDGASGVLRIEFKSLDQLDELLHRLSHFPGSRLSG